MFRGYIPKTDLVETGTPADYRASDFLILSIQISEFF